MELLLELGANVNELDRFEHTPLWIVEHSQAKDREKMIELLQKHGAKRIPNLADIRND